jgi:superfamily II DNA or RNA helicase
MKGGWQGKGSVVAKAVQSQSRANLAAYAANSSLVREQYNIEIATAEGGYQHRQLYELVQNAADALLGHPGGRIEVVLTPEAFYCANEGEPFDVDGATAILQAFHSPKRGNEIGRFGLGFKSVLGITDGPSIFSRTASFGFDRKAARKRILEVVPKAQGTPVLRVADLLDVDIEAAEDPILDELIDYASTVVKASLIPGAADRLSEDIGRFPSEFILFSPDVGRLTLDDRCTGRWREISVERRDDEVLLKDGDQTSTWHIARVRCHPSADARADAGEIVYREEVPLEWAVSFDRRSVGEFWAFFPTEFRTTLSGILNAPWKTNSDRQNLLRGEFNDELLEEAARLIVQSLPLLVRSDDPGRLLEILPGRGREARNWADELLGDRVIDLARKNPSLPDQLGELRHPRRLKLHPDVAPEAVEEWARFPDRPMDWVHPSVSTRDRRARAERLLEKNSVAGVREWLEALASSGGPDASAAAISVAARLAVSESLTRAQRSELYDAKIVLGSKGEMLRPDVDLVFIGDAAQGYLTVSADVLAMPGARSALATLGIGEIDAEGELRTLLLRVNSPDMDWHRLWTTSRVLGPERAAEVLSEVRSRTSHLRVLTVGLDFVPLDGVLIPGAVADPVRDPKVAVNLEYHHDDLEVLQTLGVTEVPHRGGGSVKEPWFNEFLAFALDKYEEVLSDNPGQNPSRELLEFEQSSYIGPLQPLLQLSDPSRVEFTKIVLAHPDELGSWQLAHATRPGSYPKVTVPSPARWFLRRSGCLLTSTGIQQVRDAVGPQLDQLKTVLPVAPISTEVARRLNLPSTLDEILPQQWTRLVALAGRLAPKDIGALYALAVDRMPRPARIPCVVGASIETRPPKEIVAATDPAAFQVLVELQEPTVLVPAERLDFLVERWNIRSDAGAHGVRFEMNPTGPETSLLDVFRPLRHLLPTGVPDLALVRTAGLFRVTSTPDGTETTAIKGVIQDGIIYWSEEGTDRELLEYLDTEAGFGLTPEDIDAILTGVAEDALRGRLDDIRNKETITDRLLAALRPEDVRRALPIAVVDLVEAERGSPLADREFVELAQALHGVGLLRELTDELAAAGLEPPRSWNGGPAARRWVQSLGFPVEYAGSEPPQRDPLLQVPGPPDLNPLHPFQLHIADRIRQVVGGVAETSRGLVSLPTGAGKTRTAVESLVAMVRAQELGGVVLWVAQNDELCEQAVQAWSEVWRSVGPPGTLAVSRLWSANEAEPTSAFHVVVATIDKLDAIQERMGRRERYGWLSEPSCVIIDEAHGSTTPEYTRLFEWLGLDRQKRSRPVIGLTATPFRGTSVTETERLVRRYDSVRLDADAFEGEPYAVLQEMGVLARVRHQVLAGGLIELTERELDQLSRTRRLPPSVEERLGADEDRNRVLLESLCGLPEDWTALVFAASVAHAQSLAARLTLEGVAAAPVWGGTPPATRRNSVEKFRRGELRVLTNYSVFAEGFDAPAVRAVYVARPTFSPNRYQQMIGRGLRGPLNGGKEECLIVDVADNVARYGGDLAFRDFESLWESVEAEE